MKKILFMAAAGLTLLGSCSSEETIDTLKGGAIEFDNPFVNKAGRGEILTISNIKNCKVWGSSSAAGNFIFDGTELNVSGTQSATYSPLQYWTASSQYYFMSIASNSENPNWKYTRPADIPTAEGSYGTLEMDVASANGDEDVVFASAYRKVEAEIGDQEVVRFSFKHALSRIRFGFTNSIAENYKIEVSNVKITGLYSKGTLGFNGADELVWTGTTTAADEQPLELNHVLKAAQAEYNGEVTTDYKFVIPNSSAAFTVDFDLDLFVKVNEDYVKVKADSYHHTIKLDSQEFLMNHAYKFNAKIGQDNIDPDNPLKPIVFRAEVEQWKNGREEDMNIPAPQPSNP